MLNCKRSVIMLQLYANIIFETIIMQASAKT